MPSQVKLINVARWVTSDQQEHETETKARDHQLYLDLGTMLEAEFGSNLRNTETGDVALFLADNRRKIVELLS